jgi:cobalt ECF transporter T component CbiQ
MGSRKLLLTDAATFSPIGGAFDEHTIGSRGLYGWDTRLKLACVLAAIALNVLAALPWLSLLLLAAAVGGVLYSRVPLRYFSFFILAPGWATFVLVLGFSVGFGTTELYAIGPLTIYREGLQQGLAAAARVACDMAWIASLVLTTPFNALIRALIWFRLPVILLDIVALAYRYTALLWEEFQRMKTSALARGGFRTYVNKCQSTARIVSQIMLRAFDRSIRIQQAMIARGQFADDEKPVQRRDGDDPTCPNQCDITPVYSDGNGPVLVCADVTHSYAQTRSLKNVSLSVQKGELVVICGPNGAGKSTLLKLMAGILIPESGEIQVCGIKLDKARRREIFHHLGILFQDPNDQLFCTHVREDVAYGPTNLGMSPAEIDRVVATAMELTEVSHLASRPLHKLSHGEMRRVGLAGVIAMQPPLILMDEPTASLDPASARHFTDLMRHLNRHHGYTLMIVTHDINVAAMIASRVVILDNGKIMADGHPRSILTDRDLLEQSRLEPPLLTRLFQSLNSSKAPANETIPLTIEEAIAQLQRLHTPT